MGTCKYCGLKAGLFSKSHDECEQKHNDGIAIITESVQSYLSGALSAPVLKRDITSASTNNFVSTEDIANVISSSIDKYTEHLKLPYKSTILSTISDLIYTSSVPYDLINKNGSLDRLSQKLIKGFMAEYFMGKKPLQRSLQISQQIRSSLPISDIQMSEVCLNILGQASRNFMKDRLLTSDEQQKIDDFTNTLGISLANLPAKYRNADLDQIEQSKILTNLQQGILPQNNFAVPIILGKDEAILWVYNNITMYQEKVQREYTGRSSGFSFRVMKGVRYRTGQFKGRPVEHRYMDNVGVGSLYVTNKNIIFQASTASVKVPFRKMIGISPYSDGMEVQRNGANVKRLAFTGFDCSFILNILSFVSQ